MDVDVDVDGMTTEGAGGGGAMGGGGRGTKYLESKLSRDQFGMPWERIQVSAYVHQWCIRSS